MIKIVGENYIWVFYGRVFVFRGYVSLNVDNGFLVWLDKVFNYFFLLIMDVYGDIVGMDGCKLVMYEVDGMLVKLIVNEKNLLFVYR